MGETRDDERARTLRWMAKAGATLVFAVLLTGWWLWFVLESIGAGFASTSGAHAADDVRTLFALLGTGILTIALLVVFAASRLRTVVVASSAMPLGLLGVMLLRIPLSPLLFDALDAWDARSEAKNLEHVESMCAFHIPPDAQGVSYHYVWDGDLLIQLKLWNTVVQSNPVAERDGEVLRFWHLQTDYGDLAQERLERAQAAVDPAGRSGLAEYQVVPHDQSKSAYREALREAQRTWNR